MKIFICQLKLSLRTRVYGANIHWPYRIENEEKDGPSQDGFERNNSCTQNK